MHRVERSAMTNARMARLVSDVFIFLGVLGGLGVGVALAADSGIWGFFVGFAVLLQLLTVALVLRLLADIADGVWRN